MDDPAASASEPRPAPRRPSTRALTRLTARAVGGLRLVRVGRAAAAVTGIGFVGAVVVLRAQGADASVPEIVARSAWWLSWAGAFVSLAVAVDLESSDAFDGLARLARLRGLSDRHLSVARHLASSWVVAKAMALPAFFVGLSGVLAAGSFGSVPGRLALLGALTVYAMVAGSLLGLLARWAALSSPRHPRSLLFALMVVPHAARDVVEAVPSVPAGLAVLLERIGEIGGRVS